MSGPVGGDCTVMSNASWVMVTWGPPPACPPPTPTATVDRVTDRHKWKHNPPATLFAGGKNCLTNKIDCVLSTHVLTPPPPPAVNSRAFLYFHHPGNVKAEKRKNQECIPVGCVPSAAVAICWGDVCPGGVCLVCPDIPMWTEFLTHASENITLPQTSFARGN